MQAEMYDFFNQIEEKHWWFQARCAIIQTLLTHFIGNNQVRAVLDIGCGTGMMLKVLQPFGKVCGLDPDEHALSYARHKMRGEIEIFRGGLPDDLPSLKQFGLVTAFDVIEHLEDDVLGMRAVGKILEPGGFFVCTVPAYQFLWSGHDLINEHKRRYTRKELGQKLREAGFTILKCTYYNTLLFPLALMYKAYSQIRWQDNPKAHAETVPHWSINAPLRWIFSAERLPLRFLNFPFGLSLIAIAQLSTAPTDNYEKGSHLS